MTDKEKIYEAVKRRVQPGIDKFNNSVLIRGIYEGMIGDAKKIFPTNRERAITWVNAMKAFRDAALWIWMANPDFDEFQVLEKLLPNGELNKIIYEAKRA